MLRSNEPEHPEPEGGDPPCWAHLFEESVEEDPERARVEQATDAHHRGFDALGNERAAQDTADAAVRAATETA